MSGIHGLTGAYAVDALDDLERARFEQHLRECEDCRTEVDSLRQAAARLGETAASTPPPALRERILGEISQVRPLPPLPTAAPTPAPGPRTGSVTTIDTQRRRRWFPALVAAAVIAILSVGASVWQPWNDSTSQTQLTVADRVLHAADADRVELELADGSTATVVRSIDEDGAVLLADGMAEAPEGKVFQLWLRNRNGDMLPAGIMPEGSTQKLLLDGDAAHATAAAISIEPAGGSKAPTTDPVAYFDFSQAT